MMLVWCYYGVTGVCYLKSAHFFGEFFVAFTDCSFAASLVVETDYLFLLSHWIDNSFESVRAVCSFAVALVYLLFS